jgi:hypothetical protein
MARTYHRDRLGRFASKGFSGQSGGRGARLMSPGRERVGGGARMRTAAPGGTIGKRRGVQPDRSVQARLDEARKAAYSGQKTKNTTVSVGDHAAVNRKKGAANPDRKQVVQTVNGKKVVVDLKRAKSGGEYGPDGHFYPGGSWMSMGKYAGTAGAVAGALGGGKSRTGDGKGGGVDVAQRTIRQRAPEPPPIVPSKGKGLPAPTGLKKKANSLDATFFDDRGFVRSPKSLYEQGYGDKAGKTSPYSGTDFVAALGNRLTTKQANTILAKARQRSSNKDDFDYYVFGKGMRMDRDSVGQDATRYRRSGVSRSRLSYIKGRQVSEALNQLAGDRLMRRPDGKRRRTGSQELTWTINGTLMTSRK